MIPASHGPEHYAKKIGVDLRIFWLHRDKSMSDFENIAKNSEPRVKLLKADIQQSRGTCLMDNSLEVDYLVGLSLSKINFNHVTSVVSYEVERGGCCIHLGAFLVFANCLEMLPTKLR
jgi:hypothetical protein